MLDTLWQDLRHGARMLGKNPGFTLVAIVSIAIGVGANAAMFSVADGLVLRPLQVQRPGEIVAVGATTPGADAVVGFGINRALSYRDYVDLRDRARSFTGLIAYRVLITSFADRPDEPAQSKLGLSVSGNFFDVLRIHPALGRMFLPQEDQVVGRDAVVVLSHETWTEQFGSDPRILERRIRLGGVDFAVIGVAPASFSGMNLALHPAFYVPIAISPTLAGSQLDALERRAARTLTVKGRLKPGVSLSQARQEADIIARSLERTYPDTNRNVGMLVRTDFDARMEERGPSTAAAFMLITLALVVLIVACANVAGLLTSRAPAREREIALRMAIGGSRFRVIRQLITESLLIAVGGGALGLAIGYGGILWFRQRDLISDIGVRLIFELDRRVLVVGLILATVSSLVSGLIPAWRATHAGDLASTLRIERSASRGSRMWGRNGLVAGQVALSLMLLTVAVFLYRAFQAEFSRPAFQTERILLMNLNPGLAGYDARRADDFFRLLKERARAIPGVTSVGLTSVMPLNQDNRETSVIIPEGYQLPRGTESITINSARIDEGYLDAIGIQLLQGRAFLATDTADAPRVVIVNATSAARYWPGQNPIGRRIRLRGPNGPWAEVVGVAADSKYNWIGEAPTPYLYVARLQDTVPRSTLLVAVERNTTAIAAPLREVVREFDPNLPISSIRSMEEFYHGNAASIITAVVRLVGGMGSMGLLLAMVGLYGLVSYAAVRRTREIGIRMAVGAHPRAVLRMVLRHGFLLAIVGTVVGVAGSVATGGLLRATFPNTQGIDLVTYVLVVPSLVLVVMLAAYLPARRAARIDPLVALRHE